MRTERERASPEMRDRGDLKSVKKGVGSILPASACVTSTQPVLIKINDKSEAKSGEKEHHPTCEPWRKIPSEEKEEEEEDEEEEEEEEEE